MAIKSLLLLCSDRHLFRPSDVPVSQIKLFIEVLIRCDGCRVVCSGTFCGEVLPSQNSGESEMPVMLTSGGLWPSVSEADMLISYRSGSSSH